MIEKRYFIETYGCQMNKAESESLALSLNDIGFIAADKSDDADLVILNTCSVRKTAEDRIWGRIGFYKNKKERFGKPKVMLIGCMAERLKEEFLKDEFCVDAVVGNFQKHQIQKVIGELFQTDLPIIEAGKEEYHFFNMHNSSSFKAFLPIMHGCNNFCSYCIVPYVRGPEISRSPQSILSEIKQLESNGVCEITLLGQNVNSYLYNEENKTYDFPDLLSLIADSVSTIRWIRLLTSHPKDFSDKLIHMMSLSDLFCRHIHLPFQHGSDKILQLMKRRYTKDAYISLVDRIRDKMPGVSLTSDILVGFPHEEEEDLQLTLDLMSRVRFDECFTYKYNPREGTDAFNMEDTVPEPVKHERLSRVINLQRSITASIKEERVGRTVRALCESLSKKSPNEILARTEQDEMVVFPGDAASIGTFKQIKIVAINGNTYRGKEQ